MPTVKRKKAATSKAAKKAAPKKAAPKKVSKKKDPNRQTGSSIVKYDKMVQAAAPGKRISRKGAKNQYGTSKGGRVYYERRANRSDKGTLLGINGKKSVMGLPTYRDKDMAREIELYADNDSQLYYQKKLPILKNLQRKYKKGTYKVELAAKLWRYFIDAALQKYNKEFGSRGDKWYELLSVPDRQLLAINYANRTLAEFQLGNFVND